ncbi:low temperature requirement protein A [Micromonospora sp. NPDC048999]|uniref:low temperature requirement protein A n=1 Tax=Micromonospora sp. NPDC048999 TaxID=3155391 RepID=UPI0034113E43
MDGPGPLAGEGKAKQQQATFLELFFDVVFVFGLTRISLRGTEGLIGPEVHHPAVVIAGLLKFVFLLLALWSVWHLTAWITSRYDPYGSIIQLVVIVALLSSMVMGVAIGKAYGNGGLALAIAYVTAQMSGPLILTIRLRDREQRRLKLRMLVTFAVTGLAWISGGLMEQHWRGALWALALGTEYVAARTGWPVPGLGRSRVAKLAIAGAHLGERYQQFFLIALGESVLVSGRAYAEGSFGAGHSVAFALALIMSVLIWWIYFHRAGQILPDAVGRSTRPGRMARSTADSHLIMLIGIVTTAIGCHVGIQQPHGRAPLAWVAVILGGPAMFTIGRSRFEHEVFGRVSPSRIVVVAALAALFPVMLHLPPLAALGATAAVLAAAAAADARRARGHPPEPPSPRP